jgi:hypothetical protein
LRSARARRDERVDVSLFDIDEPFMLLPLFIELLSLEEPVVALPVGVIGVLPPVVPLLVAPLVPVVDEPVVPPVAVPVERVVLPLLIEPVEPLFGPAAVGLLVGEPDAPPVLVPVLPALVPLLLPPLPLPLPDWASAPPQAIAAAAEMARILRVCLMHYS